MSAAPMLDTLKKALTQDGFTDILGQGSAKKQLSGALIAGRNIVIFGPPGIGKTTLAKNLARLLPDLKVNDCGYNCLPGKPACPSCRTGTGKRKISRGTERFVRIQGSPDLTAEDLLGDIDPVLAIKKGPMSAFVPGKIFRANNGVLFFDELNRCPEKLQNALLQVLEEKKATIGSYKVDIHADFIFIATMNPHDTNTEKLSDVLLDRFDVVYMGYPETPAIEREIVTSKGARLAKMPSRLLELIVEFVRQLRQDERLEKLPSVRATIGLYERAQANACLDKRDTAGLKDIEESVVSVLAHRIRFRPQERYVLDPVKYLQEAFAEFASEHKLGGDG